MDIKDTEATINYHKDFRSLKVLKVLKVRCDLNNLVAAGTMDGNVNQNTAVFMSVTVEQKEYDRAMKAAKEHFLAYK